MSLFTKFMKRKRATPYHFNPNSRNRPSLEEKLKRAKEIWDLRTAQHLTLQAIGQQKGITRERVRQVLLWYKEYTKTK